MIEVFQNLHVGTAQDADATIGKSGWFVVSAARDPWHRQALGYTTRGAPKGPDYYSVLKGAHLIMNLVDAPDPAYIPDHLIKESISAIHVAIADYHVLVHCNAGQSRAPTIALLYLRKFTHDFDGLDYDAAVEKFKTIYPPYAPARGMAEYGRQHWSDAGANGE